MKTVLKEIAAMLLLFICAYSQGQELVGKLYQAKVPIVVKSFYANQRPVNDSASDSSERYQHAVQYCEAKKGYIFQIIDVIDNKVIIRWWEFTDSSKARQERKNNRTGEKGYELISFRNTYLDYEISLADLNSKCIPYYGSDNSFTWGAVTMPIKIRFGNKSNRYFSFQESLNIGIAAGWSWQKQGRHQKSTNLLFSLGVSNVALDSLDFKMNNKQERFQPNVKSTSAVTMAGGYVFQFEHFQVGVFTGLDILPYEFGRQWLHKGKPWIGIGLGMALFNRNQESAGSGKNEEK